MGQWTDLAVAAFEVVDAPADQSRGDHGVSPVGGQAQRAANGLLPGSKIRGGCRDLLSRVRHSRNIGPAGGQLLAGSTWSAPRGPPRRRAGASWGVPSSRPRPCSRVSAGGSASHTTPPWLRAEPDDVKSWGIRRTAPGAFRAEPAARGRVAIIKPPPLPGAVPGGFTVDDFAIDPVPGTVSCPSGHTVVISRTGHATFGALPWLSAARSPGAQQPPLGRRHPAADGSATAPRGGATAPLRVAVGSAVVIAALLFPRSLPQRVIPWPRRSRSPCWCA